MQLRTFLIGMPMTEKKRKKKGRKDKRVSMHPLKLEEALGAALQVKPPKKGKRSKRETPRQ